MLYVGYVGLIPTFYFFSFGYCVDELFVLSNVFDGRLEEVLDNQMK